MAYEHFPNLFSSELNVKTYQVSLFDGPWWVRRMVDLLHTEKANPYFVG